MYTLWGGVFDDDLKAINCPTVDNIDDQKTAIFALSITGSNLESWSVVIDCRLKKREVNEKLLNLRDNLRLRRRTMGLACGPRYVEDLSKNSHENMYLNSHELMNVVKKIFPKIPFIGIFNYGYHSHFGVDSNSDGKLFSGIKLFIEIVSYINAYFLLQILNKYLLIKWLCL